MSSPKFLSLIAVLLLAAASLAVLSESSSAMPGGSKTPESRMQISADQHEQMVVLKATYRAALSALDWSATDGGHHPETLRRAQALHAAMRAEMASILQGSDHANRAQPSGRCPYSGGQEGPLLTL